MLLLLFGTKGLNRRNIEHDTELIIKWLTDNQFVANPAKFQFILLGLGKNKLCLEISKNIVNASNKVKLLGVTINNKLNFNDHK